MRIFKWETRPVPVEKDFRIGYYIGRVVLRMGKHTLVKDASPRGAHIMRFKIFNVI